MNDKPITVIPLESEHIQSLYHYTESGLNNYWLSPDLFEMSEFEGQDAVTFPAFDDMQAAIGLHICSLGRALGPREIRFLRGELNFSQRELGQILGYRDKQSVAKAERLNKNREPLSATADMLLRHRYLSYLGRGDEIIGDEYRQDALQLAQALRQPHPMQEQDWQLAA